MNGTASIWNDLFVPARGMGPDVVPSITELLNGHLPVLLVAFVATLLTVPICRWAAVRYGIVDRPDGGRKVHRMPIAYLGGAAVFVGVLSGIFASEVLWSFDEARVAEDRLISYYPPVTYAVVFGMVAIFATGILDDVLSWKGGHAARSKIAGQVLAAAGLAMTDFGTNAISGLLTPLISALPIEGWLHEGITSTGPVRIWSFWSSEVALPPVDLILLRLPPECWPFATLEGAYYWVGVLFVALVVLGASNSANLLDGLDGLLTGSVGLMAIGFIAIALMLAYEDAREATGDRAIGLEIVALFAEEDWTDPDTIEMLDVATPVHDHEGVVVGWTPRDGRVDVNDLQAFVGDPNAGPKRVHARPSVGLQERLGIEVGPDDVWAPDFRDAGRRLAAFDPDAEIAYFIEDRDSEGLIETRKLRFDLVDPERQLIHNLVDSPSVVDRSDLRHWLERGRVLEAPRDPLAGGRLVIAIALLGACLGFLPWNFNPAVIFLGDAGSLLMGFLCGALILSLGSEGRTHYVIAGLLCFALPIMDTVLAIVRRKLAGLPLSAPDKDHIHHLALRSLGSVKKAVVALYLLNLVFILLGVGLAATVTFGEARYLLVYGVAIVVFGMVGTMATKAALRQRWAMQMAEAHPHSESTGD